MDIFIEYMVKKKKNLSDYIQMVLVTIVGIFVLRTIFFILMQKAPMFGSLITFGVFAGGYFLYRFITSYNIEYEYSLVNNEIDIDKIINVRKRKKLTTINLKTIEKFGVTSGHEFEQATKNPEIVKIYACTDSKAEDAFFAIYRGEGSRKMIIFNPNEKMEEHIKKVCSQNIVV